MNLRGWPNALTIAGLIIGIAAIVLQNAALGLSGWKFWAVLGGFVAFACLIAVLLRPVPDRLRQTPEDSEMRKLRNLRRNVTVRDMAILKTAISYQNYPKDVSDRAILLAPPGETWAQETESKANERALRLIAMGVLQWRGNEIETTELGKELVEFDARI